MVVKLLPGQGIVRAAKQLFAAVAVPAETSRANNEAGINATTNLVREIKNLQDATFQMKQSIAKIGDEIDQFKV